MIPQSRRPAPNAPLEEVLDALVMYEMRGRERGYEVDRELRGAATLVAAAARKKMPIELFLEVSAGSPGDQLRKLLDRLGLEYPPTAERKPEPERSGEGDGPPDGPPDRRPPPR